ncbi:ABC transporter substrate-binding protein [Paenibacillus sp. V4I7]|uniref:ABC transporter substrate-binding protein n=1 Tax=Paenibacillus sp. V4I7 TaxID=3042307 RepID=UPI002786C257|nr:ABC transporter substrate-binding protein [Paenibacillus sp. V4I7]MDQ0903594.1 NitT/TauT family transport system substrate-binding protein [Paenibacillus sp. V4I7]
MKLLRTTKVSSAAIAMVILLTACGTSNTATTSKTASSTSTATATATTDGNTLTESSKATKQPDKVTQAMSWFAQPEMGGHYAAQVAHFYEKAGLDVTLQQGGPQVSNIQLVASGKVQFAMANADEVVLARKEGIPVKVIYANLQTNPQNLIYHKDSGIKKIEDLNGRKVYTAVGFPFWQYISYKYKLDKVQVQNYTGSLAGFTADKNSITQGFATNEPYVLKKQGADVAWFLNADLGYNPYGNVVITTDDFTKKNPDLIKRYLKATTEGWDYYYAHADEVNNALNGVNKDYDVDHLKDAQAVAKDFIFGGDAKAHGVGYMSEDRWKTLVSQMKEAGMIKDDIPVKDLYTNEFLMAK